MSRLDIQRDLESMLGSQNVYFQPPSNITMQYPCIVYRMDDLASTRADNTIYRTMTKYTVTYIDKRPDSELVHKMLGLKYCDFDRFYNTDNLNHYVYTIYN